MRGAPDHALAALLAEAKVVNLRRPKEILRQGEDADCMYLILKGRVEVTFIDVNGNRVLAHSAVPGEVLGEVEQFSGRTCAATCTAQHDSTLMIFDAAMILRHLSADILLRNLAAIFHERLTRDNRQHTVAMFYTAEDRVRIHLLSMSTPDMPDVQISQTELAGFAGCSRQTVNRVLSQLRAEGIVDMGRGAIRVLDRTRLEQASVTGEQIFLDEPPASPRAGDHP
ncbi:Crp/Fnr family transcriptional regulator [Paracoccus beibuensis]|uniref:Crp/Fnr family transcriptional regulator n=1 Tax=Paracoccus beibuensis TaxID=547602 RepID=UPI002240829C|nr:Crp/Fnr family transcriptional regulator [Paracoccus beibuensis]